MREESVLITAKTRTHALRPAPGRGEGAAGAVSPVYREAFKVGNGSVGEGTEGREVFDLFVDFLCREQPILLKDLMDRIEKDIIVRSLRMAGGNQKQAAGILGIKYTTLHEKLKKYGIRFDRAAVPFAF